MTTTSAERVFSIMNIVKSKLFNRMGDQSTNEVLMTYIVSDIFQNISDDIILEYFQ